MTSAALAAADLRAARALIEDPAHWTQRAFARISKRGPVTSSYAPDATCFCLAGAVFRATGTNALHVARADQATALLRRVVGDDLAAWNDRRSRTHAQVLAAFDRAVALAEEEARRAALPLSETGS